LAVVDEPVELCVTRLRYAQIHGFWRLVAKLSALGKEPLSLRVNQAEPLAKLGGMWRRISSISLNSRQNLAG
jgi:hypothetical protein